MKVTFRIPQHDVPVNTVINSDVTIAIALHGDFSDRICIWNMEIARLYNYTYVFFSTEECRLPVFVCTF